MTHIAGTNIDELARVIHEISTGKGFKEPDLLNLPEKLMLSVSELSEAMEEHRSNKPLVYFKCGECGAERDWLDLETQHYIPQRGVVAFILGKLGIKNKRFLCEGRTDKPEGILVEIGDSVIRNLHMMFSILEESNLNYSVSDILNMKVSYNSNREAMHGKAY